MERDERNVSFVEYPFTWASACEVGKVRNDNQDACLVDPELGLFLVADGMGGHQAGSTASRVVTAVLPELIRERITRLRKSRPRAIRYWLRRDVLELSKRLRAESFGRPQLSGMGTTLVMAFVQPNQAHITHMGDSRAYSFRDGKLNRLTRDHSVVEILLRSGEITQEESLKHPARGHVTRYVGMDDEVYADVRAVALNEGDRLLLCS